MIGNGLGRFAVPQRFGKFMPDVDDDMVALRAGISSGRHERGC